MSQAFEIIGVDTMSLSVCILTRNEEKNIDRAVRSVVEIASQVLVADTGSTDRTVDIASAAGATVSRHAWNDDFAAGRDFVIRQATGDWILWLNPDEELLPQSLETLLQSLNRSEVFGYYVHVLELGKADQPDSVSETLQLRLFRRHPALHSVGRLHPSFVPSIEEVARSESKKLEHAQIAIRRHAYLSQLNEHKLGWACRLLELELRDRPGQLHYLIEYGKTLLLLNDLRGHEILAQAVEQILPQVDQAAPPLPDVQRLLEYLLTVSPDLSKSDMTRKQARELAIRWFPDSPPILWRLAHYYFQISDFRRGAEMLERLVELGRTGNYDKSQAFDPAIIGDAARMNLGACYSQMLEFDKAEQSFIQLLDSRTEGEKAAKHLAIVQTLRSQNVPATTSAPLTT